MGHSGKSCSVQCEFYAACPVKTRVYINYCGVCSKQLVREIREAFADCVSRKARHHKVNASPLAMKRFKWHARDAQKEPVLV